MGTWGEGVSFLSDHVFFQIYMSLTVTKGYNKSNKCVIEALSLQVELRLPVPVYVPR